MPPLAFPPRRWTNQDIILYHGTVAPSATTIVATGVACRVGRTHTDFGPGFYTTTLRRQALMWALQTAALQGLPPAIVKLVIPREELAKLDALAFVRGDFNAGDFWSLVHHCRSGATDHRRPASATHRYYDVVYGPVAAFWGQRATIYGADQVSFHTKRADAVLKRAVRSQLQVNGGPP